MSKWRGLLRKLDDYRWAIPASYKPGMLTEGIVYAGSDMLGEMDESLEQVANVAFLPGIVGRSMAMPDIHWGYGFPIGGVAAMRVEDGVVSPGGVGFDINCGVRMLRTDIDVRDIRNRIEDLVRQLYSTIPTGVGGQGRIRTTDSELRQVMLKGASWAVQQGLGWQEDLDASEERGSILGAEPDFVSPEAVRRGRPQLGTLGSGNHFVEIQAVDEIFDHAAAETFGITQVGQVTVMLHTGSRGFGHQVCQDSLASMQRAAQRYKITLPDRQLACAPVTSEEGQKYLGSMSAAANFAWANRQIIAHNVREAFEHVLGVGARKLGMQQIYDVAHNMARIEEHEVDGVPTSLCVHRKGATRAFGPGHASVPPQYRHVGQPVIVPGDMGRYSFLLVGTETAMRETWGSTCHGAGRVMSRNEAIRKMRGRDVARELEQRGIVVKAKGRDTLSEEASCAYKDVADVVDVCQGADISRKVAKLRPLGVAKG